MLEDEVLAGCELSQDLLYGKIPENKRAEYIDASLRMGRESMPGNMRDRTFISFIKTMELKLCITKRPKDHGSSAAGQAVMSSKEKKVELYRSSIESLAANSSFGASAGITPTRQSRFTWRMSSFITWSLQKERVWLKSSRRYFSQTFWGGNGTGISTGARRLRTMLLQRAFEASLSSQCL